MIEPFTGFRPETFEFFMAIRFNNNQAFFHDNHDWYQRDVRQPCLSLAEALQDCVYAIDPDIEVRPTRVVSRINRDIRFSNDKSPYRDYLWLSFRRPVEREMKGKTPDFYFDIGIDGVGCGMGFYDQNKPMMNALRAEILRSPDAFRELIRPIRDSLKFSPRSFKRFAIPESVPEDLKAWYALKCFYCSAHTDDMDLICSPALADWGKQVFESLTPIYRFLMTAAPMEEMPQDIPALGAR